MALTGIFKDGMQAALNISLVAIASRTGAEFVAIRGEISSSRSTR